MKRLKSPPEESGQERGAGQVSLPKKVASEVAPDFEQIDRPLFTRRRWLGMATGLSVFLGVVWQGWLSLLSFVPRVLYEPNKRFKVGKPEEVAEGVNFIPEQRAFVFKEVDKATKQTRFYCISAICTHLGCTVKYVPLEKPKMVRGRGGREMIEEHWEFHCPCHGSKFYGDGTNYAGPAPRPLDWYEVFISPDDGSLTVDKRRKVEIGWRFFT